MSLADFKMFFYFISIWKKYVELPATVIVRLGT